MTATAVLIQHALETIKAPRQQARWAMSVALSRSERWQALVLNTVVSTILLWLWIYLTMGDASDQTASVQALVSVMILDRPVMAGIFQVGFAVISVHALHWGGRVFGGSGELDGAVSLLAWMTFVLNLVSVLQIVLWLVFPIVAELIGLFSIVLVFVLLTSFCAELHGFRSLFMTFIGLVFSIFAILFGFSLLVALV
ncbi:MAG: YIP1 family protein [Rhodobacter sp.]|nr:YIP1 family protein [Rhodobacter sp.]MCY4168242.1 YIP1 family protein [Rhodobacter sp.]MCY4240212.1 YIP1 family protein [Rhodobacter sp.]